MNGLHQQLEAKRRQIAADEKTVEEDAYLHETHLAKERLPRLRSEACTLETDIELGEAAAVQIRQGLNNARTIATGGRELALAMTYLETAEWRLRCHLGTKPEPVKEG